MTTSPPPGRQRGRQNLGPKVPNPLVKRCAEKPLLSVLQVAIRTDDGVIHTLPRPARHGDVMYQVARVGPEGQGFLLSDGTYADREQAWKVAHDAGQPILRHPDVQCGEYLFTEDLW